MPTESPSISTIVLPYGSIVLYTHGMSEKIYTSPSGTYQVWRKAADRNPRAMSAKPARYEVLHRDSTRAPFGQVIPASQEDAEARAIAMADRLDAEAATKATAPQAPAAAAPADPTLATERQVSTIIGLLKARRISGEEGGFMSGPTDTAAIRKMTRAQASAYITSLKGAY